MDPTIDLAVRTTSDRTTAAVVSRAHRDPTDVDWQQWAPTIAARYKSVTVRVFVDEMKADGLRVTYVPLQMTCVYYISAMYEG